MFSLNRSDNAAGVSDERKKAKGGGRVDDDTTARKNDDKGGGGGGGRKALDHKPAASGGAPLKALGKSPVKGTRDFPPPAHRLHSWLTNKFRSTSQAFSFQEYDCPVLEHEEVYLRKEGEDVSRQIYSFEDKSGRRLALRVSKCCLLRLSLSFPLLARSLVALLVLSCLVVLFTRRAYDALAI